MQTEPAPSVEPTMAERIVELNNVFLKSDRGTTVFKDLSLTVESGKSAVIQGPAGSGKTLLIELLLGLRYPDSGSVEMFGRLVKRFPGGRVRRMRRKIGGVGGQFALLPNLTVSENITLPLVLAGERKKTIKERLRTALSEFALLRQASEYPRQLTRVENTLALFARASIAHQPLLLIDEPLAGLDSSTAERVFEWMSRAALAGQSMLVFSSEELNVSLPGSDKYRLEGGALV